MASKFSLIVDNLNKRISALEAAGGGSLVDLSPLMAEVASLEVFDINLAARLSALETTLSELTMSIEKSFSVLSGPVGGSDVGIAPPVIIDSAFPYYGPDAPWNIPVAGLVHHSNETALVAALYNFGSEPNSPPRWDLNNGAKLGGAAEQWTYPVYDARGKTFYPVVITPNNTWGNLDGRTAPWDGGWEIPPDTDAEVQVLNPETGEEWNWWRVTFDGATITCGSGALVQKVSDPETSFGDAASFFIKENGWRNSGAIGIPRCAAFPFAEEIQEGVIKHALDFLVDNRDECDFFAPATKLAFSGSNCGTGNDRVPIGTRFSLEVSDGDIDTHLATLPAEVSTTMKASFKVIAQCLRDYGFFIVDHTGGPGTFRLEHRFTGQSIYNDLDMGQPVSGGDGRQYPLQGLQDLFTEARLKAYVVSTEY